MEAQARYAVGETPLEAAISSKDLFEFMGSLISHSILLNFMASELLCLLNHSVRSFRASCNLAFAACCLAVISNFSTYPSRAPVLLLINSPSLVNEAW